MGRRAQRHSLRGGSRQHQRWDDDVLATLNRVHGSDFETVETGAIVRVLLGSGDNHGPVAAAEGFRALLESHGVTIYFNGHNHAYERTARVKGKAADPAGTMYLTVGGAGAAYDGVNGDWFTAADFTRWTRWGEDDAMATYLRIRVDGVQVTGDVYSLGTGAQVVDHFP